MNYDRKGRNSSRADSVGFTQDEECRTKSAEAYQEGRLRADGDETSRRALQRRLAQREGCRGRLWHPARGARQDSAAVGQGGIVALAAWHQRRLYVGARRAHDFCLRG